MTISADIIAGIKTKIAINKKVWGKILTAEEEGFIKAANKKYGYSFSEAEDVIDDARFKDILSELTITDFKKSLHYIWYMAPSWPYDKGEDPRKNHYFAFDNIEQVIAYLLTDDFIDKQTAYINTVATAYNKKAGDNYARLTAIFTGDEAKFKSNCEIFNHAITLLKDQPSLSEAVKSKLTDLQNSIKGVRITDNKTYRLTLSNVHKTEKDYITELVTEVSKFTAAKSPEDKKEPRALVKKWSNAIKKYGVLGEAEDKNENQKNADVELKKWIIVDPCRDALSGDGASGAIYKKMGGGSDCPEKPTAADYESKLKRHEAVWNDAYYKKTGDKAFAGVIHVVGPELQKATKTQDQEKLKNALKSVFETYCKQEKNKENPAGLRIPLISLGIFNSGPGEITDKAESTKLFMDALYAAYNDLGAAEKDFIYQQLTANKIEICCYKKELYNGIITAANKVLASLPPKPSPGSPAATSVLTGVQKLKEVKKIKEFLLSPKSDKSQEILRNSESAQKIKEEIDAAQNSAEPNPSIYQGLGLKIEIVPEGLKILDIYAPQDKRFKEVGGGGLRTAASDESVLKLKLKGKIITKLFINTGFEYLGGKSAAEIIKLFRSNANSHFVTNDNNAYEVSSRDKHIFAKNNANKYVSLNQELENVNNEEKANKLGEDLPIIKEAFAAAATAKGAVMAG